MNSTQRPPSAFSRDLQRWSRWAHVYTSMTALLVVLFFAVTGLTLNHPSWTFGDDVDTMTYHGVLPFAATAPDAGVAFLSASEYVRATHGVKGRVDSFGELNGKATIAYRDPAYSAELFFDLHRGTYELTVQQQGWVAVMNDLHKGRDTASSWRWVIDVSAGLLVVVSLTGLVLQVSLRKRRRLALTTAGVATLVMAVLVVFTLR